MATYTVQEGDTLSGIAEQHGVALDDLIRLNPQIANPDLIHPGDEVTVSENAPVAASEEASEGEAPAVEAAPEAPSAETPARSAPAAEAPREMYGAREAI